ncbi:hypothetical protein [Actinomadura sp. 7K507]|uniref:hypothetical protein n=1 Tax=Actinomadura sp. 7K507 TaxID=2530365 RepID=UPI001044FA79|nr:hypothetical protein [Actinomadura sp. 7K507]TDC81540.1 hypothetical protein E1285_32440 [Actinomadura sp. 7K507]
MAKVKEESEVRRRKKHRIFPWIFLAIQILFLVWVIVGASSGGSCPPDQQGACEAGTAIGVGLVIAFWVAVDIILALTYLVFRLFRR